MRSRSLEQLELVDLREEGPTGLAEWDPSHAEFTLTKIGEVAMLEEGLVQGAPLDRGGSGLKTDSTQERLQPVETQSVRTLIEQRERPVSEAWVIKFHDLAPGESAYNASDIFMIQEGENRVPHILVRVEGSRPDQEFTSRLTVWRYDPELRECWPAKISNLAELVEGKVVQDPSIAFVKGQPVISWVRVTPPHSPGNPTPDAIWESEACTGESMDSLKFLVATEEGSLTKGLRFVELLDHRIGVFTRPNLDGRRKICFGIANDWGDITTEFLSSLKEIEGLSVDGAWGGLDGTDKADILAEGGTRDDVENIEPTTSEDAVADGSVRDEADTTESKTKDNIGPDLQVWGGPNDPELLPNGDISLGMHLGWYEEKLDKEGKPIKDNRRYVVAQTIIEPPEGSEPAQAKHLQILLTSDDIKNLNLVPKRPDLGDVLYTGFILIEHLNSPTCILVVSAGDAVQIGSEIPNPLLKGWGKDHPEYMEPSIPELANETELVT